MAKILIVDDDPSVRGFLRQRLEGLYDIADTGNPEEALAMALQIRPDCILLDLMMPKHSGFELCQTLGSLSYTQRIPILIVSGEPAAKYEASCQRLGAAGYIEKPVNFAALKTCLASVIHDRQRDHRSEVRVRLSVNLKVRGIGADGAPFEIVTHTENVSASGFRCICTIQLQLGSVVTVFAVNDQKQRGWKARAVWVESRNAAWPVAGFRFVEKPHLWVL